MEEGDGQLDGAEGGAEMPSLAGNDFDNAPADLAGELGELLDGELPDLIGGDGFEQPPGLDGILRRPGLRAIESNGEWFGV